MNTVSVTYVADRFSTVKYRLVLRTITYPRKCVCYQSTSVANFTNRLKSILGAIGLKSCATQNLCHKAIAGFLSLRPSYTFPSWQITTLLYHWRVVVGWLDVGSINQSWCTIIAFGHWRFYTIDYFKIYLQNCKTSVIYTFLCKLLSFSQKTPYFWSVFKYFSLVYIFRHFVGAYYTTNSVWFLYCCVESPGFLLARKNRLCIDDWSLESVINRPKILVPIPSTSC